MKKNRKKQQPDPAPQSRGVDRVPERFRDVPRPVVFVHEQPKARSFFRPAGTTYRNPDRIHRLAKNGRLRKELRP